MLALTEAGFHPHYLRGVGQGERLIGPELLTLLAVRGGLTTAWFVLFVAQAALVPSGRRRVYTRLGWGVTAEGVQVG